MIDWAGYLQWKPAFLEAIDTRLYNPEWLDREVQEGRAKVWRSPNSCALTELRFYPTGVADVHGLVAAGDVTEIRDILIPAIEVWARSMGCAGFIIESREGWAKVLKSQGFEPHQLAVRKEFA